ncbi:2-dehydro-3-deoxy-6-phosphogalactonate aldolase [Massilia sp. TS11]|uniref:2-dehydro-3-deoxy-6-phosphogalactonate aldolase n=1 Tax=Massilia sp. TS11 TaxID=2908003 RepID=UPI001EDA3B2A|nr:2-dehydro-3-deoxy-6-phosphogalactonate aldolase [Massilia sp. TS11]MCG2586795.1 2-dehydro-3-deoxy-6-phosphogalactonate aldolase [Massilia sp. TS11]
MPFDLPALPLVAILRGLAPERAAAVGAVLFEAGFRLLEVPLNRPGALEAIATLVRLAPPDAIIGGGTMLCEADVDAVAAAGGRLFVAPNMQPGVIAHAARAGMFCAPGVATPTEAFAALAAGAHALKLFPGEMIGPAGLKAMKAVLPPSTLLWPVGGVEPANMGAWRKAGATGFGLGSALFTPETALDELRTRAAACVAAWEAAC